MDLQSFFKSKTFTGILIGIGIAIAAIIIFNLGMFVGYQKANFSYRWSENYQNNFAGPRQGFMAEMEGHDFIDSHGVFGQIIKLDNNSLVIKGRDNVEKIISLSAETTIHRLNESIKAADLQLNDLIVVIGDPDDSGKIAAKLIRVMPSPPGSFPAATDSTALPPASGTIPLQPK